MISIAYGQQKSANTLCAAGSDADTVKKWLFTGESEKPRKFWHSSLFPFAKLGTQLEKGEHAIAKIHSRFRLRYPKALKRPQIKVLMPYRHPGDAVPSPAREDNLH